MNLMRGWAPKLCAGLSLLAVALTAAYLGIARERATTRAEAAAVATLPVGAQAAWTAYVDRRLATTLRPINTGIAVLADIDGFLGTRIDIPYGVPFDVACPRLFGGIIHFKSKGETVTTSIFGSTVEPPAERPPPLGVDPHSIAAVELQKELCAQIARNVHTALLRYPSSRQQAE
jgi:hypothetical protein